jgi:dTMP kinase
MVNRGRLIALEGGEGAGKSTQAERLARALGAELTREPGGSVLGETIRGWILDPDKLHNEEAIDVRAELMLVLAARAQHVAVRIRPALEQGKDVVVDRYSSSTLAYQGYGRGLPLDRVRDACDLATGGLWPDLTVLLDVPAAVGGARRAQAGGAADRIESENGGFHARVAAGFLALAEAEADRWVVIEGSGAPDDIERQVLEAVDRALGTAGRSR